MERFKETVSITDKITLGGDRLVLFAGPCAAESYDLCLETGTEVKKICQELGIDYVFKASFDKANRTSIESYRGPGIKKGIEIFSEIKKQLGVKILTDFHLPEQAQELSQVVDALQVPAFLCRQTDMILAGAQVAVEQGIRLNIKKGQFLSPNDCRNIIEKVQFSR